MIGSQGMKGERRDRLRVLLTINGTDVGGTETALAQLARELGRRKHHVTVMSLKTPGRLGRSLAQEGITVETLDMGEEIGLKELIRATWLLRRWLSRNPQDVVHSFLPRANIVSRVANRLSGKRSLHVSSERSTDLNRGRFVIRLNRMTAIWTDVIVVLTEAVRSIMEKRDGLPADKMKLIGNGIDVKAAESAPTAGLREDLGVDARTTLLCSVGRLIPDKGHAYLLESLSHLDRPSSELGLVLVGDGPEDGTIRETASDLGLENRVHMIGYRSDVTSVFKDVDIFVLPSLEEGIPVTVLEAMACSLPVIATTVGGVADLVDDGTTGILVPPAEDWTRSEHLRRQPDDGAIAELTRAIEQMVDDRELRSRYARQGRERVNEFDLERLTDQYEDLYYRRLDQGSRSEPARLTRATLPAERRGS